MSDGRTVGGGVKHINLVVPEWLNAEIRELAKREQRSISGQIRLLIEKALKVKA